MSATGTEKTKKASFGIGSQRRCGRMSSRSSLLHPEPVASNQTVAAPFRGTAESAERMSNMGGPLYRACERGQLDVTKKLILEDGIDINTPTAVGWTPFMYACAGGSLEVITWLHANGADIHHIDRNNGCNSLMHSASQGRLAVVKWLLEHKADMEVKDHSGANALHLAAGSCHKDVVNCLIEAGSSVNSTDIIGRTPMMKVASSGKKDAIALLDLLHGHGAAMDAVDDRGDTALKYAARPGNGPAVSWFIKKGFAVDTPDMDGATPLMRMAKCARLTVISWLLKRGADVACTDNSGKSVYDYARDDKVRTFLRKEVLLPSSTRPSGVCIGPMDKVFGMPEMHREISKYL